MHNSVKLLCARPEKDAQPFASSWGGTEDRNREFFQIQRSNFEKSSKSHACVLRRTKTALLIDGLVEMALGTKFQERRWFS